MADSLLSGDAVVNGEFELSNARVKWTGRMRKIGRGCRLPRRRRHR